MQTQTVTKSGLIGFLLFGLVVFTVAGFNGNKNTEFPKESIFKKVLTDFKSIIAKDLTQIGMTTDLGFAGLEASKNNVNPTFLPPPPITVTTIKDTYIREDDPLFNFGGSSKMEVEYHSGSSHDRRGLMKIDLSTYSCVIVESATLYMYLEENEDFGVIVEAFEVTQDWNEGTGNSALGTSNWIDRKLLTPWNSQGGGYDNSTIVGTMTSENLGYRPMPLDVSVVQSWINNPASNNGLIFIGKESSHKRLVFTTTEGTGVRRPYLELNLREACCNNGIDDDGDGNIDNVDGDCGGYTTVSTDTPITIPSNSTASITSTITVSEYGTVTDINVLALDILHSYIGDISVTLTSPEGTVVQLRNNGCSSNDNLFLNFDQSGLPSSAAPCPPVDATNAYQAYGNLNDFNGEEIHGDWTLTVDDNYAEDGGTFLSWSLQYFLGTGSGICGNGMDEDGDGLMDAADPDCDCGTNYILTDFSGNGADASNSNGISNLSNATGDANGTFVEVHDTGDNLVIELSEEIPAGTEYTLVWRQKASYTSFYTAEIVLSESVDNISYTQHPFEPSTAEDDDFIETTIIANVNTKFIKMRPLCCGSDDFDFDAVYFDSEGCQLIAFEMCNNGIDDDDDGLVDGDDPDCSECAACFTPVVSEFLIPFPENQVFTALSAIYPSNATCGISVDEVAAPIYSYVSISAFLDNTIIYYDHWEDGFEVEPSNPTQSTTEIWGDGNLSNGYPPSNTADIITEGTVIILNNPIDPTTLQTVVDFDGGDALSSSYPLSVTRAAWAAGTETLLAGALEVFPTESWGLEYTIPVGTNVDPAYQYFQYTGAVIMAAENNTTVNIDADANGSNEISITLDKGESYQINGSIIAGASIVADKKVQVDVITGDICDHYESRWFTLPPQSQWEDNYYTPVSGTDQVYQVYNPNNFSITLKRRIKTGLISDITIPANSNSRFSGTANTGYHLYTTNGSVFYPILLYNANTGTGNTGDLVNSTSDWGAALLPYSRLTKQVAVGWAPGQDPTYPFSENGSPVWVTAFYPPGSVDAGSGQITVCVDFDGDNSGPLTDSYGRKYDISYSLDELEDLQIYDSDGNQTNMVLYICDDKDALLSVMWGQENGVATPGAPGLDVGTGIPGLNPFFSYKTVALIGDADNNGDFSLGDTIQYSIGIQNPGLVPVSGNYVVTDDFPIELNYIENTTFINDGTNTYNIADAGSSSFPLDEGGVTLGISLEPRAEAVVSFNARIVTVPVTDSLITNYATVTKDGIRYEPKVTIKVTPVAEICGNGNDDDLNGITDCDCESDFNIVRGMVFNDDNESSIYDNNEVGLNPITVNIYSDNNQDGTLDSEDNFISSTTTDNNGFFDFAVSATTFDSRIIASDDDAEQNNSSVLLGGGTTTTNNSDLDLGYGYTVSFTNTIVGLRYQNLTIPAGAIITDAYLEFTSSSNQSGNCAMDVYIEATDNANAYQSTNSNLSNRFIYTSPVDWDNVPNWSTNQTYQSPNLSSIVQQVIDRPGWSSGNDVSFLITGTDAREAFSYEDDPAKSPKLVVTYAFFPAYYMVEMDTSSVLAQSTGAKWMSAPTRSVVFSNEDDYVCEPEFAFAVAFEEICENGIDDDMDGFTDCDDSDVWDECCLFDEWNYDCDDGICTEIVGIGIKNNLPQTLTFTDVGSISHIVIEATFDGGGGHPDAVTFTNGSGLAHTVDKINFDTGNDKYYRAFFDATNEITLTVPNGTNANRGESFIAYIFRNCENTASAGAFTHKFLHQNSHTFTFDIPTSIATRDIEIVVPLSEITNDGRIAQIKATAGAVSKTITIDDYNFGNSLNITPFTLESVAGNVSQISIEVISPLVNGQSLYLSGAGSANVVCPQLALDKRVDDTVFKVGETVTYTYVIYNAGDETITGLTLNDDQLGNISLPQTTIIAGDSLTVTQTFVVQASDLPGGITNVATVNGMANSVALTDSDTEYIDLIAIDLVKTANPVNTTIGATVTYSYEITNNGSAPLQLDLVDDKLGTIDISNFSGADDVIAFYDFSEGNGTQINDNSDFGTPINLSLNNANYSWNSGSLSVNADNIAINNATNTKLYNEITTTGEMTVEAWVTPASLTLNGPARIVSFSDGTSNRNFTIGQENNNYAFRIRTTTNGNNGSNTELIGGTLTTNLTHIAATWSNTTGIATLYVNGVAVDSENLGGDISNWDASYPFMFFNETGSNRDWFGTMSMVAIYDKALTATEISNNYNLNDSSTLGILSAGETATFTAQHIVTNADAPSPLVNIADVTGSPPNHPKEVTDQDTAEVYFNNPPEICGDEIDNDFDGLTDCDDPDCTTPSLTFNGNTTVCAGESTTITAVGNENDYTYQWSNGLGNGQTKTITPPSNPNQNVVTTYSVTVTDAQGCTAIGTIDLTAESLPAATVSFSDEFCNQGNGFIIFTFNDHPNQTQLSFSIDGGSTYPYTSQDNNGTFAVSNLSAGSYDLWVRWGSGNCPVDLPDVTIGNTGGPSVAITGPTSICIGEPAQITALATDGTSPYLYIWDNGLGNGASKTVFPTTTTTYAVTATDNKGCTDTDQIVITVLSTTDPACSDCPNPADDDGDGVCESEDCDDNDPNIPAPPGTACDDGNPNSVNDEIQADECTCAGDFLPCDINFGVQINQPVYNDNSTSGNLSDDSFTFSILISGNGSTWTADGQSGAYGTTATFGPYSVDASGVSFDIVDTDNPSCRENISVNIASCIYSGVCTCCE